MYIPIDFYNSGFTHFSPTRNIGRVSNIYIDKFVIKFLIDWYMYDVMNSTRTYLTWKIPVFIWFFFHSKLNQLQQKKKKIEYIILKKIYNILIYYLIIYIYTIIYIIIIDYY